MTLDLWLGAARTVIRHIGITRGERVAYSRADKAPWPTDAAGVLERDTRAVMDYLARRHELDVRAPLERLVDAAKTWMTKRDAVIGFLQARHADPEAATTAREEVARLTEAGLPEQRRLNLDLRIAEGAVWLARFPLISESSGGHDAFRVRRNLLLWALWVLEAISEATHEWSLPDATAGWLESEERWELANVVLPRRVPDTGDTPKKLAIEEARRVGDLDVVLPLINAFFNALGAFVAEATRWPQDHRQPSGTEALHQAISALDELVGLPAQERPETPAAIPIEETIPIYALKAGEQYRQAVEALGVSDPTDRAAYEKLARAEELSGEKGELPTFDSWQRNLRTYRRLTGQQKRLPRAGRAHGSGSLVRADQLEPEQLPSRIRRKGVTE